MPIFIAKFLINRKFSVRIGGTLSEIYDQEEGVPQGSILAVTLFSIKINRRLFDMLSIKADEYNRTTFTTMLK